MEGPLFKQPERSWSCQLSVPRGFMRPPGTSSCHLRFLRRSNPFRPHQKVHAAWESIARVRPRCHASAIGAAGDGQVVVRRRGKRTPEDRTKGRKSRLSARSK